MYTNVRWRYAKDLYSKPAASHRPSQHSLTALATEFAALFQQQQPPPPPRNIRNPSTLLRGMARTPFPLFSSKRPDPFSSPVLNLPHSSAPKFSKTPLTSLAPLLPPPPPLPLLTLPPHQSWLMSPAPKISNCLNRLLRKKKYIKIHYQIIASCQFSTCQVLKCKLQSN